MVDSIAYWAGRVFDAIADYLYGCAVILVEDVHRLWYRLTVSRWEG